MRSIRSTSMAPRLPKLEIDQRPVVAREAPAPRTALPRARSLPDRRNFPGSSGTGALAAHDVGRQQQVERRATARGTCPAAAALQAGARAKMVEPLMRRRDGREIARSRTRRGRPVIGREAGEIGRHGGVGQLGLGAGDDAHPRAAGGGDRRKHHDIVEHDRVGLQPRQQLPQRRLRRRSRCRRSPPRSAPT